MAERRQPSAHDDETSGSGAASGPDPEGWCHARASAPGLRLSQSDRDALGENAQWQLHSSSWPLGLWLPFSPGRSTAFLKKGLKKNPKEMNSDYFSGLKWKGWHLRRKQCKKYSKGNTLSPWDFTSRKPIRTKLKWGGSFHESQISGSFPWRPDPHINLTVISVILVLCLPWSINFWPVAHFLCLILICKHGLL